MNLKRVHRLHPLEGLRMRRKPMRRLAMAQRRCERPNPLGPNQVWVMVWIHEELFAGRRIWALTVVDVWSCLCPVPRACRQAKAAEVVEALEQAVARHGAPGVIRVGQGYQFTSRELDLWGYGADVKLDFGQLVRDAHLPEGGLLQGDRDDGLLHGGRHPLVGIGLRWVISTNANSPPFS